MNREKPVTIEGGGRSDGEPLRGMTVLVTRSRSQSAEITSLLEESGAKVIHCPTIEFAAPSNPEPLIKAIDRLETFDWIVFTSANAVSFFFARLNQQRTDADSAILGLVTCAIGLATARACLEAAVEPDVIAKDSTSEGVVAAIIEYAGGESELSGVRFLLPRARVAREVLPSELVRLGAQVESVEAYQTLKPEVDCRELVRVIEARRVDAVTFTSPSTVTNFASLVGVDLSALLHETLVACVGPVTAGTAAEHGLTNIVQPETFTASALVEAIVKAIGRPG